MWVLTINPYKDFPFGPEERFKIRVGAQIYNILNHQIYDVGATGDIMNPNGPRLADPTCSCGAVRKATAAGKPSLWPHSSSDGAGYVGVFLWLYPALPQACTVSDIIEPVASRPI